MLSGKGKILLCCLMLLLVTGCSGKNTDESEKSEKFQSDYMELIYPYHVLQSPLSPVS